MTHFSYNRALVAGHVQGI